MAGSKAEKDMAQELEIPDSLIVIDDDGRICVGGKCMNLQYEPNTDNVVVEISPNAKCSPLMKKVVSSFAKAITDEKTRMKFRSRRVAE